ncbi:hypothetical protein RHGRI_029611 [Rhododendron griersonianum]|uniref:Uncharacterized protein n=1 Tax=Rhododendron griersonianum TaxID=479676 RepID=A0AAV6INA5_9ERIC|nr:hypothetical protein RHGRI_029611 [Rhododendron griersonianum]
MKSQLPVKSRASFLIAGEEEAAKEGGKAKEAEKVVFVPTKVESLTGVAIKMVALGSEHSLAVTDKGEALSWGEGESGRLGHGHEPSMLGFLRSASEFTPRLIKKLEGFKIKSIAAGMLHSACIDENGSVFVFGERAVDKLGLGRAKNATRPSMIGQLPFSEEVACGGYHTCVITSGGELYTWGSNENGCLGTGCTDVSHFPERVQGPFLKHAVCQLVFRYFPSKLLHDRYPVAGSIQQLSLKDRFMHGAGEVLMERFLRTGIPLVDNWVRGMMLTTLRLHESFSGEMLKHYKYHVDSIIQCKKNKTITSQLEISDPIFYTGMELNEFTVIDQL